MIALGFIVGAALASSRARGHRSSTASERSMIRAILAVFGIVRRERRERVVLHVPQSEAPACIRESARCVLMAHGMWLVDRKGVLITDDRFEQLLREIGNNCVQGLYSVDQNPENA